MELLIVPATIYFKWPLDLVVSKSYHLHFNDSVSLKEWFLHERFARNLSIGYRYQPNSLAKKNCYCTIDLWNSDMHEMSSVIVEFVEVEDRSFATYQLSLVILNSVWRQLDPWSLEIHLAQVMISFIYNI